MALCGFNEKMFDGFREFAGGVLVQLEKRAQEQGGSLKQALEKELIEITAFEAMLQDRAVDIAALSGVTQIVKALFVVANEANDNEAIVESFWRAVDQEIEFYRNLDQEFYNKLIPEFGSESAVGQLGVWIDRYPI